MTLASLFPSHAFRMHSLLPKATGDFLFRSLTPFEYVAGEEMIAGANKYAAQSSLRLVCCGSQLKAKSSNHESSSHPFPKNHFPAELPLEKQEQHFPPITRLQFSPRDTILRCLHPTTACVHRDLLPASSKAKTATTRCLIAGAFHRLCHDPGSVFCCRLAQ